MRDHTNNNEHIALFKGWDIILNIDPFISDPLTTSVGWINVHVHRDVESRLIRVCLSMYIADSRCICVM